MKKYLAVFVLAVLAMAALAGPAAAYRIAGRSNVSGLFRDLKVCTDGLQFNIGRTDDIQNREAGYVPDASVSEQLYITSDLALAQNPITTMLESEDEVLSGVFEVAPIANNDSSWDGSGVTRQEPGEGWWYATWVSTYSERWNEPLAPGTELAMYLLVPDDNPPPQEILTVTDCLLFPCEADGAILGTENRDVIIGTPGDDIICSFGGNDTVRGNGGNDTILGGNGRDTLIGGGGMDKIFGENGHDNLVGNSGADLLDGGQGRDRLYGNQGNDVLIGGPGFDMLIGGSGADTETQ